MDKSSKANQSRTPALAESSFYARMFDGILISRFSRSTHYNAQEEAPQDHPIPNSFPTLGEGRGIIQEKEEISNVDPSFNPL